MLHHFDGYEDPSRWWQPCPRECTKRFPMAMFGSLSALRESHRLRKRCSQCSMLGDRLSAVMVYRGQYRINRPDRRRIPVVSHQPGFILRPNATKLLCIFGADAGTRTFNCRQRGRTARARGQTDPCVPGCGDPPEWCTPEDESSRECNCQVGQHCTSRPRPMKPKWLGWALREHAQVGDVHQGIDTYTGYAELVVDSSPLFRQPAATIEAVFFTSSVASSLQVACSVRRAFVHQHHLHPCDVPLVRLRTDNWETPFELYNQC